MRFGKQDTAAPEPEAPAALAVDLEVRERDEFKSVDEKTKKAIAQADRLTGEITDQEAASEATDALAEIRNAIEDGETARKALKKPFDAAGKRVQAAFKELASPLEARKQSLEDRFLAYEARKEAAATERRRQEEAETARAQEAENTAAEAEGRAAHHVAAPAPRVEPTGARGASGAKGSPTTELKYRITDEDELPDEYVERVPRKGKILADVREGIVIPGVEPFRDKRVQVR
jgi:chromosome segregation ATPase